MPAMSLARAHAAAAALIALGAGCGAESGPDPGPPSRPLNVSCFAPARVPEMGSEGLPPRLSATGCFDPADPTRPLPALIPYEVNAPLWSDGAAKERWLALPEGARVSITPEGDFELPPGSVTVKTFQIGGRPVETRFFVRLSSGEWAGYTYEWNEEATDAVVVYEGSRTRSFGDRDHYFPTRAECLQCHTAAAGYSLGLEIAQLNRDVTYPGGRTANQLSTWRDLGLFESSLAMQVNALPALPSPDDRTASPSARARAYLHANCSNCHRPLVDGSGTTDFRFSTALTATMACDAEPLRDNLGAGLEARIIAPGRPDKSMVVLRMLELGRGRMPEIASLAIDRAGVAIVSEWIAALTACQ
jgi:uncharacterized repeat protein (TIGR03806 family)